MGADAILSIAGPMIGHLVGFVERKFGAKKGPHKLSAVVAAAQNVMAAMRDAGDIAEVPATADIQSAVESVVQNLKADGRLNGASTTDNCTITIPRGSKITIELP